MLRILFISLSFVLFAIINCNAQSKTNTNAPDQAQVKSSRKENSDPYCEKWQRFYELLSDEEKEILHAEGIVSNNTSDDDDGYLISANLVKDCRLRLEIGRYIRRIIAGMADETDVEFASKNSKEIVKVLRHIWNGHNFSSDGVSSEKYGLLWNEGLKEEDVAPFISELLKTEGLLKSDLIYVLITRPMPSLKSTLVKLLKEAKRNKDLTRQIYALIILQQVSPEPKFLSQLETISQDKRLPSKAKEGILEIIRKFRNGERVTYKDIEDLGLPLEE